MSHIIKECVCHPLENNLVKTIYFPTKKSFFKKLVNKKVIFEKLLQGRNCNKQEEYIAPIGQLILFSPEVSFVLHSPLYLC